MAKGNLFQGMGRGKVGDVVFSRLNGEQLSRVRNRNPKNPNTNKQLYQRAIMATVMQAYSAGIVIFDHAFQGRDIGAANQRRFISLNAKLLRSQVAADIKGAVALEDQQGRVVAPGVSSPVAAALQVSEGTLRNVLFGSTVPEPLTDETVGAYCARIGLVAGDLFTFVGFKNDSTSEVLFSVNGVDSNLAKQFKTQFLFARYAVKESAISDTTTAFANLGQVLELTDSNFTPLVDFSTFDGGDEAPAMQTMCGQDAYGSYGWIRSRRNSDLRSKCILSFDSANTGIASQYALQAWSQGTANLGDSDLILEGGPTPAPTPEIVPLHYISTSSVINDDPNSENYGKYYLTGQLNDGREGFIYATAGGRLVHWQKPTENDAFILVTADMEDSDILTVLEGKGVTCINLGEFNSLSDAQLPVYNALSYNITDGLYRRDNTTEILVVDGLGRCIEFNTGSRSFAIKYENGSYKLGTPQSNINNWGRVSWYQPLVANHNQVVFNGVTYDFNLAAAPASNVAVEISPALSEYNS